MQANRSITENENILAMETVLLPLHDGLRATSRLRFAASKESDVRAWEWCCLVGCGGIAAAASTFLVFSLRIPGHAILRAVFPMAIGLALVPRRGAGTVMGFSALAAALAFRTGGFAGGGLSLGALTSLTATGPLLDWTLRRNDGTRRLYLQFAIAGLCANALAFLVRGGMKWAGPEHLTGRPFWLWLPQAAVTYPVCGLLAGLLGGAVWFYGKRRDETSQGGSGP